MKYSEPSIPTILITVTAFLLLTVAQISSKFLTNLETLHSLIFGEVSTLLALLLLLLKLNSKRQQ